MPRIVRIHENGGPEVLRIEETETPPPGRREVTIDVKALGLNRSEAMFRAGRHIEQVALPARLGYEAAGIVSAVGVAVDDIRVGDAVSVIPPPSVTRWGAYGERVNFPAEFVVKHPASLTWVEAASIWMQNITAYGGLIDIGGLAQGDAVVIVAASSSVGLAAIQVANAVGAISIATTRSRAKQRALLESGADHVIVTDEEDLVARVNEITDGRGARVIFDPVAGAAIETHAEAMSKHGILIAYGMLSLEPTPFPLFKAVEKGLTFRGFTFKEIVLDADRRAKAKEFILEGLGAGFLKPTIDKTFTFDQIIDAHRYLESNQQFGKIVVTL
jgi:NADPH:quinone reductase-like Zn-dependent oxidoreductase